MAYLQLSLKASVATPRLPCPSWVWKIGTLSGKAGGICHVCAAAGAGCSVGASQRAYPGLCDNSAGSTAAFGVGFYARL